MPLLPSPLAEGMTAAHVDGCSPLQVRKAEIDPAVSDIRCAQEREKRLVLIDGQELPVAECPTFGREAETHDPDLTEKWFCHSLPPYVLRVLDLGPLILRRCALQRESLLLTSFLK